MQRQLPLAGRIMVRLDNSGKGYTPTAQGGIVVDVAKETAASAIARLSAAITAKGPDDIASSGLASAQDLFSQGKIRRSGWTGHYLSRGSCRKLC